MQQCYQVIIVNRDDDDNSDHDNDSYDEINDHDDDTTGTDHDIVVFWFDMLVYTSF